MAKKGLVRTFYQPPTKILVSGKIEDKFGNSLPGVAVQVLGTNLGTQSNFNTGQFRLTVEPISVLRFSSIGFKTLDIEAASIVGTIILEEDLEQLDEITISTYLTKPKNNSVLKTVMIGSGVVIAGLLLSEFLKEDIKPVVGMKAKEVTI